MENPHQLLWNNGQGIASRSAVIVQSVKLVPGGKRKRDDCMPTDHNVCVGFIAQTEGRESYIAVHESHINMDCMFYVYHAGGERKHARVFFRNTELRFVVLEVSLDDPNSQKVKTKKILDRGDILMLSARGSSLVPFFTSAINPITTSTSTLDWRTIAAGSEQFFTFGGYRGSVRRIMGAPLFLRDGYFIGVVWGDESTLAEYEDVEERDRCPDLKYGLHATFFLSNLRKEIKARLESKKSKLRNFRRR